MPMKIEDYPNDWRQISQSIRFGRAGGVCEEPGCGARHGSIVYRDKAGRAHEVTGTGEAEMLDGIRTTKIILTTAHTCTCLPLCGDPSHLLALCQLHHLRRDVRQHARTRAANRRARQASGGQGFLIPDIDSTSDDS